MTGNQAYILSKGYTDASILGTAGPLRGKNCKIKSITPSADGKSNIVTFEWTADDGSSKTSVMTVFNGTQTEIDAKLSTGVKIATITIDGVITDIYAPEGGSGDPGIELTQAEYDALPEEEKLNGTVYYITDGQGGGGGSASLTSALDATKTVGGVNAGKHYDANTDLEVVIRDILAPTLYPSFTMPSCSLSGSGTKLLEKGATLSVTLTATFSRGSITPPYNTSGYRSGPANGYSLNGGASQSGNTFSQTVTESNKSFYADVTYDAGEQPLDSAGKPYSTPLPAGTCHSNTVTYEYTEAMWSNAASISSITKMSLVKKSTGSRVINFPDAPEVTPETFDIPASWVVSDVQVKNDLSGQFESCIDEWDITNVSHDDAGGTSVAYKRYTNNLGFDMGAREIKVLWS